MKEILLAAGYNEADSLTYQYFQNYSKYSIQEEVEAQVETSGSLKPEEGMFGVKRSNKTKRRVVRK